MRNFLTKIQVFFEALGRILELAVMEVLHDCVLHLLLHVQELQHIKKFIIKKRCYERENL
jgi:hypothetical protein